MRNFHEIMRAGSRYDGKVEPRHFFNSMTRMGWTGQHTNKTRAYRRAAIKAAGGIRQFKKQRRNG